jgi:hypothetical protein
MRECYTAAVLYLLALLTLTHNILRNPLQIKKCDSEALLTQGKILSLPSLSFLFSDFSLL